MSETGEEDNVMNRKKKRIQRAQSGQSGASGRRKKSDSSRPVPSGSGKVSPVLSNEADLDEQKITGSNTQASPAAQATPLVDELDGDGKPSPSAKPPIPKPAVEQKITNSMRKDFVRHRIDSTRSEVSNPMNDGYHLFTMMNMLSILGKDEEYVKSFVDRIMYLARPFENKNIDLNVLASKKVDGLGKMDASRVSDRMAEIAEMKSIMESEFETDWKNEENVDPSKLDEDRSEYRQYIIENITGAVISVGKFEDMAGIGHGLSFEVMSCASDVEIFRDTYRDRVDHESMNKLLESTRIYKEDSLILDESIKLAKARTEEVQRHNKDVVERNFEMAGSTLGV
ncbi:MAG: hypothetical protein LBI29_03910 [Rickettsiales bacterium]|jgi:hypothetical protein|nr:hypothetical protein [Rickettsiales bacterium]